MTKKENTSMKKDTLKSLAKEEAAAFTACDAVIKTARAAFAADMKPAYAAFNAKLLDIARRRNALKEGKRQ